MVGNINEIKLTLDKFLQVSPNVGIKIYIRNVKCQWPNFDEFSWDIYPDSINKIREECIDLLCSSIFTSEFINNHMVIKVKYYFILQHAHIYKCITHSMN